MFLWFAIFSTRSAGGDQNINGMGMNSYLAYALWAAFFARISANWAYEFRMSDEIESGSINSLLTKPMSFFEYYLFQLLGHKAVTTFFSLMIPLALSMALPWPMNLSRIPLAIILVFYYLVLVHLIAMCVTTTGFFINRTGSITVAKNLILWLLTGELVPLDIVPSPWKEYLLVLPFSSGVYYPVAYITGRIGHREMLTGFLSVTAGIIVVGSFMVFYWRQGLRKYVGTGA